MRPDRVAARNRAGRSSSVVDRDRAVVDEPGIVGRPGDAEDGRACASGELHGDRADAACRARDRHRVSRCEAHRAHGGVGGGARDVQRTGHLPRHRTGPQGQLIGRNGHVLGLAGPSVREPDDLIAHDETVDAGAELGHHPSQVAALTGRERQRPEVMQRTGPQHRLTDVDACCPDLDQNLTGCREQGGAHRAPRGRRCRRTNRTALLWS